MNKSVCLWAMDHDSQAITKEVGPVDSETEYVAQRDVKACNDVEVRHVQLFETCGSQAREQTAVVDRNDLVNGVGGSSGCV